MKNTELVNLGLIILIVFVAFNSFISPMLTKGMFLDGMIYGDLARKVDYANIWSLHISDYGNTLFFDHPPLVFCLEGLFFKLFGDYFWVEHSYSILMFFTLCIALHLFVKNILELNGLMHTLIVILFFILAPIVPWSFSNNMLENTTIVLSLFSSYFLINLMKSEVQKWKNILLSALFLTLGFLAKGPVCLFPIAIPFFHLILYSKDRKANFTSALCLLGLLITFTIVLGFYEPSRMFLSQYLDQQIFATLKGERAEFSKSRFRILTCLLNNTLLYIAITTASISLVKESRKHLNRQTILLLLIGFSASLPLLLTPKQACVYIVPALPYFLLAVYPLFRNVSNRCTKFLGNKLAISTIIVVGILVSYFASQNRQRLPNLSADAALISQHLPAGESLNLVGLCDQFEVPAFLIRYNVSSGECDRQKGYYISRNEDKEKSALTRLSIGWLYTE